MIPATPPDSNITFTLPGCIDLPAKKTGGQITTVWKPSEQEKKMIAAGAGIAVCIISTAQPPMKVYVPVYCAHCDHEITDAKAMQLTDGRMMHDFCLKIVAGEA